MTFFVDAKHLTAPQGLDGIEPGFGEYLGAVWGDTWSDAPTAGVGRSREMLEAMYGRVEHSGDDFDYEATRIPPSAPLSLDAQKERFASAGLGDHLKPHKDYTPEAVDILVERKQAELERKSVRERAPWSYAPAGIVVGLGAALLDPLNTASAFVPVVGEARLVSMLGQASVRAGGALGRAGVRAGAGAVEGLAGAAMMEPLTYMAKTQEQADYGMTEAMLNVGFGAMFGGAVHAGGGAMADVWRARTGRLHPWAKPAPEGGQADGGPGDIPDGGPDAGGHSTAALREDFGRRLQEAHPDLTPDQARAGAALFDARARTWGRDMLEDPAQYYEKYGAEFKAGEAAELGEEALLQAAMYRNRAESVDDFVAEVLTGQPNADKSFYPMGKIIREDGLVSGAEVQIFSAQVQHISTRHPEFNEWTRIPEVIARGEAFQLQHNHVTGGLGHIFLLNDGDSALAVLAAPLEGKKLGKRMVVLTAFRDNPDAVRNWVARMQKKSAASSQSAGGSPAYPSPRKGAPSDLKAGASDIKIDVANGKVKPGPVDLTQSGPSSPRASTHFSEDGKAVITFFASADATSAPHEIYHIFRREMAETVASPHAPDHVRQDWQDVLDFVGAKEGQAWTKEMEEAFAEAAERYLIKGEAPVPELAGVFERLKAWFVEVYRGLKDSGAELSPAMRGVFDRMLDASDRDAAATSALLRALDSGAAAPEAARLRAAYAGLTPDDRQSVFRVALAQAHDGRAIDVEALVLGDMDGIRKIAAAEELREQRTLRDLEAREAREVREARDAGESAGLQGRGNLAEAEAREVEQALHEATERVNDALERLERSTPEAARCDMQR